MNVAPKFRPLTPAFGAEVLDVDLREPQPDEVMATLAKAWNEYGVLLFRDQDLSPEAQIAFTQYFAPIKRLTNEVYQDAAFMHIGNVDVDGIPGVLPNGEMWFHQDGCYSERPMRQTFLYALELPSIGGNTKFASTSLAYQRLPSAEQQRLQLLNIRFTYSYGVLVRDETARSAGEFVHPLVIAHPATGKPFLFCNRLMADEIIDLQPDESRFLLERLCTEIERPEYVYEHVWRLKDFLMWDNLATAHARTDFDPNEPRLLRRSTTEGVNLKAYRDTAKSLTV
jgi:taurine dioxygenase